MNDKAVVHTGIMNWRCLNCHEEHEGIRISVGLQHSTACLRYLELECRKCGKRYRWDAKTHLGLVAAT